MRQKVLMSLLESVPPPPSESKSENKKTPDDEVVELEPMQVTGARDLRALSEKIDRESQRLKNENFSIIKGGTIYRAGRIEIGTWGDPSGLTLLKLKI